MQERERAGELFVKMKPCKEEMIRERKVLGDFGLELITLIISRKKNILITNSRFI